MGTIEVEPAATLLDEYEGEKCVGEGGHFFVREGDYEPDYEAFIVCCERCGATGYEQPDPEDRYTLCVLERGSEYCVPCYRQHVCGADVQKHSSTGICGSCGVVVEDGLKIGQMT